MKKNKQSKDKNSGVLSVSFFRYLIKELEALVGSEVIREFEAVKSRRDRYLREEWIPHTGKDGSEFFREIDYDYLLTLLKNHYLEADKNLFDLYMVTARTCIQFGELQKAHDLLGTLDTQVEDTPEKRTQYLMLKGKWAIYARDLELAQACYQEALDFYKSSDNKPGIIKALNNLGIITFELWETDQGKRYFQEAEHLIEGYDGSVDPETLISVKTNLGILDGLQGNYSGAIRQFEALESENPELEGLSKIKVLLNKGVALKGAGNLETAESILGNAAAEAKELPSYHAFGDAILDLSEVNILQGDFKEGKQNLSDAFKVFSKMHDRASLAETYRIFGVLYRMQDYDDLAASQFEISIKLGEEFGNLLYLTETYYEYSLLAKKLGKTQQQKEYLSESLSYAKKMHASHRVEKLEQELADLA
ncbi:MAG: hypothetical protein K9N46_12195 [Candidatus Marinimicrobia bacterium]|nr:hypothetical protein [Candidatus Neomarinimicrobiota bacterium]MCF7829110.1 hypothetical protein [Candidatus Neomarinimicrobiota bacterium]MCF7881491.1 hypothetical protein [Candidatus Neomarinimicrobiota bacterium]